MSRFADKVTSVVDGKTHTVSTVRKFDVSETLVFDSVNAFQAALGRLYDSDWTVIGSKRNRHER